MSEDQKEENGSRKTRKRWGTIASFILVAGIAAATGYAAAIYHRGHLGGELRLALPLLYNPVAIESINDHLKNTTTVKLEIRANELVALRELFVRLEIKAYYHRREILHAFDLLGGEGRWQTEFGRVEPPDLVPMEVYGVRRDGTRTLVFRVGKWM